MFASAVKDVITREIIVKLVNSSANAQDLNIDFKGNKFQSKGKVTTLTSAKLDDVNSFESPTKISPTESEIKCNGDKVSINLPAHSVSVLKLKLN